MIGRRAGGAPRSRRAPWLLASALGGAALLALVALLWMNRPFQAELGAYRTSLAERSEAQRQNIWQAARALDGVVIEPGATFSFNEVVGPRTPERGYRQAPAFMERDLVTSVGGGICQVSSTLYNAAVLAGLQVVERHPHFRRVASVPAGRDATVWYGMADLRLANVGARPLRLAARVADEALMVVVAGHREDVLPRTLVTRPVGQVAPGRMAFETVRRASSDGHSPVQEVLSLDVYRD